MKKIVYYIFWILPVFACSKPPQWSGPVLMQPRDGLTAGELLTGTTRAFVDMSYFSKPKWAANAKHPFSGTITLQGTELNYLKGKEHYLREKYFPKLQLDFISHGGELIPRLKNQIITRYQENDFWDVFVGTGKIWHEKIDGEWSRASFPLTLTDRWIGTARNCVATFVYKPNKVSNVYLQCSQETADIDNYGLANISGIFPAGFQAKQFSDSMQVIEQHTLFKSKRLPVHALSEIDSNNEVAEFFEKTIATNAPTSLGAVLIDEKLYLHPPKTRHGLYPYPSEMRHGLYSVTKSMAGALVLMYFEERYKENVFNKLISDYVPALAEHKGWRGVTFSQALNMVTGTEGSESSEHLLNTLVLAESAEEAINNIARLGNYAELPGQKFNYASTNLFVLSYALQKYVEEKEGDKVKYWDLIHQNVLVPINAEHFTVLHTLEEGGNKAIPILAYGALPTIDEAAKIAVLFASGGNFNGKQILNKERVKEVFDKAVWRGHSTNDDFRGANYQHSFWSKIIETKNCKVTAIYMLGFGENYVIFLPSKAIIFRFLDEHDMEIDTLIKAVEEIRPSCG